MPSVALWNVEIIGQPCLRLDVPVGDGHGHLTSAVSTAFIDDLACFWLTIFVSACKMVCCLHRSFLSRIATLDGSCFHAMNFYDAAFVMLVSTCGLLTWRQYNVEKKPEEKALNQTPVTPHAQAEAGKFKALFLTVYCLVMGADWLQGTFYQLS